MNRNTKLLIAGLMFICFYLGVMSGLSNKIIESTLTFNFNEYLNIFIGIVLGLLALKFNYFFITGFQDDFNLARVRAN